jgi:hypothetical protein
MRLLAQELDTSSNVNIRLMRIALISLALALPGALAHQWIHGPVTLGAAIMLWTASAWIACFYGVLERDQRARLYSFGAAKLSSKRAKH